MKSRERAKMESQVTKTLKESKAVLEGHFIGASGKHLDKYINKNLITLDPRVVSQLGGFMARLFAEKNVEVVVGPSSGAVALAHETAEHLTKKYRRKVISMYTEKDGDKQVLKRGFPDIVNGKNVLAVEDILTTGGSLKQVVDVIAAAGGKVVGAAAIINRNPTQVTSAMIGVPTEALLNLSLPAYDEGEVPPELAAIPIRTDVGHGAKYLATKKS